MYTQVEPGVLPERIRERDRILSRSRSTRGPHQVPCSGFVMARTVVAIGIRDSTATDESYDGGPDRVVTVHDIVDRNRQEARAKEGRAPGPIPYEIGIRSSVLTAPAPSQRIIEPIRTQ